VVKRSGFSFVEIIITMMIISVMTVGAGVYYTTVLEQTNRDKATSDLKQLKKILLQYDSELPAGLTTYSEVSESIEIRDLRKLVEARKMPELPADPWGNEYRIDIQAGIIYSQGLDPGEGYDKARYEDHMTCEDAIRMAHDDIIVRFKPKFDAERARVFDAKVRNDLVSIITIDFTRPVDYTTVTTTTSFEMTPMGAPNMTTAVVDILNRSQVKIWLDNVLPSGTPWKIVIKSNELWSVDDTTIEADLALPVDRPHDL